MVPGEGALVRKEGHGVLKSQTDLGAEVSVIDKQSFVQRFFHQEGMQTRFDVALSQEGGKVCLEVASPKLVDPEHGLRPRMPHHQTGVSFLPTCFGECASSA